MPWSMRWRKPIIIFWLLAVIATLPLAATVTSHLTYGGFENPTSTAVWAQNQAALLTMPRQGTTWLIGPMAAGRAEALARQSGIAPHLLHRVDANHLLFMAPPNLPAISLARFRAALVRAQAPPSSFGPGALGQAITHATKRTLTTSSALALPILAVLLLLVFGSVATAVLPLIIAGLGAELSLAVISVLSRHLTLSVYLTDIVSFLALGVGVDYALFITSRFREGLRQEQNTARALSQAMATAGRSVFFSGLAVALAMSTLVVGGTSYWHGLALGGAIAVTLVLAATHSLLPALLATMGPRIERGKIPSLRALSGLWPTLARQAAHRAWLFVPLATVLLLLPASAAPSFQMSTPANVALLLPPSNLLRRASAVQQRVAGPGSLAPMIVVLMPTGTVHDPATWRSLARLTAAISRLHDVAQVLSPTGFGLSAQALAAVASSPTTLARTGLNAFMAPARNEHLLALYVTPKTGPDQSATALLARRLPRLAHQYMPPGTTSGVDGVVPLIDGFNRLTAARLPWIIAAVAFVAFVVLLAATGSLLQAFFGVLIDALVALATAGILVLTVQRGGLGLSPGPLETAVTPLIFVLLFGLSMDYEVILLHRVRETFLVDGDARRAAAHGLARTGAMITGAGLIMVVVFVVLLTSSLDVMKALAIGMTSAILLDTWLARTFLVPGILSWTGRLAFWPGLNPSETHRADGSP